MTDGVPPQAAGWILDASDDGLWVIDRDGITVFANQAMARILGRTGDLRGLDVADTLDATGREQWAHVLAEPADSDSIGKNRECLYFRPDGEPIWGLATRSLMPLAAREAGFGYWLVRVTPYAEQRAARETLQMREQQLAEAHRLASLGHWNWDVVNDVMNWSDEIVSIFGVERGEVDMSYAGVLPLVVSGDRSRLEAAVAALARGSDSLAWEGRVQHPSGDLRWVRCLGQVQRDAEGNVTAVSGTAQDITAISVSEAERSDLTRRLKIMQLIASAANDASTVIEAAQQMARRLVEVSSWRPAALYAVSADGLIERTDVFEHATTRGDLATAAQAASTGATATARVPGLPDAYRLLALPISIGDRVIAVIEMVTDTSELSEDTTNLLIQASANLSRVAEREQHERDLAAARDHAMEASRLKSEFLATMSHEIRTPMNGVIGLNELLLRTELSGRQRELALGVHSAGQALLTLINDILDLSKVESGKLQLESVVFDLRAVIDRSVALLASQAADKAIALVVEVADDVPHRVIGDPTRLSQVVTNLVSNAVKFTDEGRVSVAVSLIESSQDRTVLRFAVTDTGIGIAPGAIAGLFDAFTQADLSTTRRHGGTGLGLAISRQLVEAMSGELSVQSALDHGSCFTFTVALGRADDNSLPDTDRGRPRLGDDLLGRRVLVVEDNEINQMVALGILESLGLHVEIANDGFEAVSRLHGDHGFDLVLMDCRMPGLDGFDATRAVRSIEPGNRHVPIVAMTASALDGERERCLAAGMDDFLTKPVDPRALHAVADRWLRESGGMPIPAPLPAPPAEPVVTVNARGELPVLDLARKATLSELVKDGEDFFTRTARSFLSRIEGQLAAIRDEIEKGDPAATFAAAHSVKGSALNLGLPALAQAAAAMENSTRDGSLSEAEALLEVIREEAYRASSTLVATLTG